MRHGQNRSDRNPRERCDLRRRTVLWAFLPWLGAYQSVGGRTNTRLISKLEVRRVFLCHIYAVFTVSGNFSWKYWHNSSIALAISPPALSA